MLKPGTWTFKDKGTGATTQLVLTSTSPSAIKAAFQSAQTTLGGAVDQLEGFDPAGHPMRYTSTKLNANMTA